MPTSLMTGQYFSVLVGKDVSFVSGEHLGTVVDMIFQTERGTVESLLVKPADSVPVKGFQKDKNGFYVIPMRSVSSIKDLIIIDNQKR
ncbi:MAG: PRC-barrel domain-containing protein [Candidatus Thermoplasmatota archaeon]|nr:PRC-barrel domain-containing protein [Candidatus Thermoplasmatota archaeon]